jgi:hypothetical protein
MLPDTITDAICGSNLILRAQQALVVDTLAFGRFLELCSLLEMVVLAERIFYFRDSPLRGKLVENFPQVFFNCDGADTRSLLQGGETTRRFDEIIETAFRGARVQMDITEVLEDGAKQRLDDDVILDYRRRVALHFGPADGAVLDWLAELGQAGDGRSVEVRYFFRTFLYEGMASALGITSAHDGLRLPLALASKTRTVRSNFEMYWAVSEGLRPIACPDGTSLYVRPIPALIFNRCQGQRGAAITQVAELREYFSEFRGYLRELEERDRGGASIREKERARAELRESLGGLLHRVTHAGKSDDWLTKLGSNLYRAVRMYAGGASEEEIQRTARKVRGRGGAGRLGPLSRMVEEFLEVRNYGNLLEDLWPSTAFARAEPFHRALEKSPAWEGEQ